MAPWQAYKRGVGGKRLAHRGSTGPAQISSRVSRGAQNTETRLWEATAAVLSVPAPRAGQCDAFESACLTARKRVSSNSISSAKAGDLC